MRMKNLVKLHVSKNIILDRCKVTDIIEKFYSGNLSFKSDVKYPLIGQSKIIISMVLAIICAITISFI